VSVGTCCYLFDDEEAGSFPENTMADIIEDRLERLVEGIECINRTHLKNVLWPNIFVGVSL
jgi:hypothetical protein